MILVILDDWWLEWLADESPSRAGSFEDPWVDRSAGETTRELLQDVQYPADPTDRSGDNGTASKALREVAYIWVFVYLIHIAN